MKALILNSVFAIAVLLASATSFADRVICEVGFIGGSTDFSQITDRINLQVMPNEKLSSPNVSTSVGEHLVTIVVCVTANNR